jgi:adenosylhomocysteine nucleosidase
MKKILKVGIICPCPLEFEICSRILRLTNEIEIAGRVVTNSVGDRLEVVAVRAGPGKVQCASATQLVIDLYQPDLIIDVGGAGALSAELKINDIICVRRAFEYNVCDIGEFTQDDADLTTNTILAGLTPSGSKVMDLFTEWVRSNIGAGFVTGDLASGERNIASTEMKNALHEATGAIACNWETSAVLKTARLNKVRSLSFRVITDRAGEDMKEELERNWGSAVTLLITALNEFLFYDWIWKVWAASEE